MDASSVCFILFDRERLAPRARRSFIRQQADHPLAHRTRPHPHVTGFGVHGMAEMVKILHQCGPPLAQTQSQPLAERIMRGNGMGNDLGMAQQDIAPYFVNHVLPPAMDDNE